MFWVTLSTKPNHLFQLKALGKKKSIQSAYSFALRDYNDYTDQKHMLI